jgi:hypothetical protein
LDKPTTVSSPKSVFDLQDFIITTLGILPLGEALPPVFVVDRQRGVATPLYTITLRRKCPETEDIGACLRDLPNGTLYLELGAGPL